jgi:hypothetical protein
VTWRLKTWIYKRISKVKISELINTDYDLLRRG